MPVQWTLRLAIAALVLLLPLLGAQADDVELTERFAGALKNWGLHNTVGPSDIKILPAWKISQGDSKIIVAIIDTGLDINHPDLRQNLWTGVENVRVGDRSVPQTIHGWDFVTQSPITSDAHGHGTHVAGIIGARFNPSKGVAGVSQHVALMPLRYYSPANTGRQNLENSIKALHFAIDHGAQIINYSGGGPQFSEAEFLALKRAEEKGILVVCAAGNEHQNTDLVQNYYYPAAYGLSNIISVAAIDVSGKLIASSNFGKHKVDLAAPGENIFSTLPKGRYGTMTGTSQGTPHVAGVAQLLKSLNPSLTPSEVKARILASVDQLPGLKEKVRSGGKLNAYKALQSLGIQRPENRSLLQVTDLPTSVLERVIATDAKNTQSAH